MWTRTSRHRSASSRTTGAARERQARRFLTRRGLTTVQSNYRCPHGEIDLIMRDGDCLVFVEVKYRRSARFGGSIEQVSARKRERLMLTALHYLAEHGGRPQPACRFDVVGIEGDGGERDTHWVKNAFEP